MAFVSTLVVRENNRASSRFLNIFFLSVCLSVSLLFSLFSLHQIHCNLLGDLRFFHDCSWFFGLALCACCFSRVAEFEPTRSAEFEKRFGTKIKIHRLRLPRSYVLRQRSHVCRPRSHVPVWTWIRDKDKKIHIMCSFPEARYQGIWGEWKYLEHLFLSLTTYIVTFE